MKRVIVGLVIVALTIFGCKKDKEVEPLSEINSKNTPSQISAFFDDNFEDRKQTFEIDPTTWSYIVGENGTILYIPEYSFEDNQGNLITNNMTIELTEILNYKAMLQTSKTTTSKKEVLVSGGQLYIRAIYGGNKAVLIKSINTSILINSLDYKMNLFEGDIDSQDNLNWTQSTDSISFINNSSDPNGSNEMYYSFLFNNPELGWINCDYFWNNPAARTTVTILTDEQHVCANTRMYMVFKSINSVSQISCNMNGYTLSNLPVGEEATIVAVSEINGQFYSSFQDIVIEANHVEILNMEKTTREDVNDEIANL